MMMIFLAAALVGCHTDPQGSDTSNPNDTGDTGTATTEVGYLDGHVFVNDGEEACMANIFDVHGDLVGTDQTGDDEFAKLEKGDYTVSFGFTAESLFPASEFGGDFADEVDDLVDGLYLHPDANGDLWADSPIPFSVYVDTTSEVDAHMNRVFAMCPESDPQCREPGTWTCEEGSDTWQDLMELKQQDDGALRISIPCIGDLNLDGERIFSDGYYEGSYISAGYVEVHNLTDSSRDVRLWVGDDGDEPR